MPLKLKRRRAALVAASASLGGEAGRRLVRSHGESNKAGIERTAVRRKCIGEDNGP